MQRHVDSSLSSLIEAVKSLLKRAEIIAHSLVLISKRNAKLKAANKAAIQRKLHKRKQVQKKSTLAVTERVRLTTLKEFNARSNRKKAKKRARVKVGEPS
jgi:hypothetical protein